MPLHSALTDRLLILADLGIRAATLPFRRFWWMRRNAKLRRGLKSIGTRVRISEPAELFPLENISIGSNVVIHGPVLLEAGGGIEIGSNIAIARDCRILTSNHIYDGDALPWDHGSICKRVTIEDNVWIGSSVIILPGVTIGEGAIVGAGSVVTRSIGKGAIAVGNPAREIRKRDMERYERNKAQGNIRLIPVDVSRHTLVQ